MNTSGHVLPAETLLRHAHWLRHLLRRILDDEHAVEDAVQDAWVAALETPPRHPGALRSWLARTARHVAIGAERRQRRMRRWEERAARPERQASSADLVDRVTRERDVVDAVLALEEPDRAILLLRYYEDLAPREIAERLGIPEATYWTRHRRALTRLRGALWTRYGSAAQGRRALLPLLCTLATHGATTLPLGTTPSLVPLATGTIVMTGKTLLVLLSLALALTAFLVLRDVGPDRSSDSTPSTRLEGDAFTPRGEDRGAAPLVAREALRTAEDEARRTPSGDASRVASEAAPTRLVGRLVGEDGAPVADARLELLPAAERTTAPETLVLRRSASFPDPLRGTPVAAATTDADGRFDFSTLAPGRVTVDVVHPRFLSPARDVDVPANVTTDLGTLTLRLGAVVRGRVLDDLQRPVADCRMEARPTVEGAVFLRFGGPLPEGVLARAPLTAADGSYEIGPLQPRTRLAIVAHAAGCTPGERHVDELLPGQVLEVDPIVLPTAVRLAGTVVDPEGRPFPGAQVQAFREGGGDLDSLRPQLAEPARTNAEGRFELRGLADGPYRLVATGGAHQASARGETGRLDVLVSFGDLGRIAGRVVSQATGAPLAGAEVALLLADRLALAGMRWPAEATTRTDEEGRFRFESLGRTAFAVEVHAAGHATRRSEAIDLATNATREDLVLALEPGARLVLQVVDAGSGEPVAGASVAVEPGPPPTAEPTAEPGRRVRIRAATRAGGPRPGTPASGLTATTDARGEVLFRELDAGPAHFAVTHPDFAPQRGPLVVRHSEEQREVVRLGRGGAVRGRTIDALGRPLADRAVELRPSTPGAPSAEARSDAQGAFHAAHLAPGSYEARFAEPGLGGPGDFVFRVEGANEPEVPRAAFEIAEGEETSVVLRDVPRSTLEVVVRWNGLPAADARVAVRRKEAFAGPLPTGLANATPVDAQGLVTFRDLTPGTWVVSYGLASSLVEAEAEIELDPLATRRLDVELPGGSIEGTVVDESGGAPLAGVDVRLRRASAEGTTRAVAIMAFATTTGGPGGGSTMGGILEGAKTSSDERGRFAIEHVPPGSYVLEFTKRDFARVATERFELARDERRRGVRQPMARGGALTGRVLGTDGSPATFAIVNAQRLDADGAPVDAPRTAITQDGGSYALDSLTAGTYRVSASRPRMAPPGSEPSAGRSEAAEEIVVVAPGAPTTLDLRFE